VNGGRGAWKQGAWGACIRRGTAPSGGLALLRARAALLNCRTYDFTTRRVPLPGQWPLCPPTHPRAAQGSPAAFVRLGAGFRCGATAACSVQHR
jgi:hypothetical protein